MTLKRPKRETPDYLRGVRDFRDKKQPESGHPRLSKANLQYMAGYWDTCSEHRRQREEQGDANPAVC